MGYELYLSYSGRKTYETCPEKYRLAYILKDKTRGDPRGSFLGSIIGKVFEWFYTRKAWATTDPVATSVSYIDEATQLVFRHEKFNPDQDPAFCTILRHDLHKYVPEGIETIRNHNLLSPQSRTETDLTVEYTSSKHNTTLKLGGRSDFLHGNTENDIYLMDGKASKHRDKYIDAEQLIWYANLYFIKYHIAPIKLGFIFWCFPEDPIKWISYNNNDMRKSLDHTFEIANKIKLAQFEPTPSAECHICNFKDKCDVGSKHLAKHKIETRINPVHSLFEIENV